MSTSVLATNVGLDAMVSITAHVPEDAMSAGLLGTERSGHGVRIREDGLIVTIGYVVHEAESLWIGTGNAVVPGFVVGYDFDSGLALVKPSLPLQGPLMELGRADSLNVGDTVSVVSSSGRAQVIEARVVAKQEFAGRWEYVLDQAVFTSPPHRAARAHRRRDHCARAPTLAATTLARHARTRRSAGPDRGRRLPELPGRQGRTPAR
jgi:hypothetical protein